MLRVRGAYANLEDTFSGTPVFTPYEDGTMTPNEGYTLGDGQSKAYAVSAGHIVKLTNLDEPAEYTLTAEVSYDGGSTWATMTSATDDVDLTGNTAGVVVRLTYEHKDVPKTGVDVGQSTPVMLMITVALLSAVLILALPKRLRRREDEA